MKDASSVVPVEGGAAPADGRRLSASRVTKWDAGGPRKTVQGGNFSVWKASLARKPWYMHPRTLKLKAALGGGKFASVMVVALLAALFMPDMWVLCGVNSNTELDVILIVVMFLFTLELVLLSICDANYFLSFFWMMDIFGTVSMIFDVTLMLGSKHTEPQASSDGDAKKNLMLLRAARAAKVGARAGRLSRVLRILRFLPLLKGGTVAPDEEASEHKGIATNISSRLANLLGTRVAALTILLVMIIPLFDLWTFPQDDYSLQAWVERLSSNLQQGFDEDTVEEMKMMVDFYDRFPSYGPFRACTGRPTSGSEVFICEACGPQSLPGCQIVKDSFSPGLPFPPRVASTFIVHSDTFMVAFNMHGPVQLEAGLSIATILFIIFIMVFSGLALSSVVNELAVRPLERMLSTVREIATTVFKFSAEADIDDDMGDDTDLENANEMKLLERVVHKLSTIAELQTRHEIEQTEDMGEEDIGILSMMRGKNVVEEKAKLANDRKSCAVSRRVKKKSEEKSEDFGISQEDFLSLNMDINTMSRPVQTRLAAFIFSTMEYNATEYFTTTPELALLQRFLNAVEKEYPANPFHNYGHAIDVLHGVSRSMKLMSSQAYLTDLERFSLLVAATAHDVGHPGVNNGFLTEVGHELALQYNDRSPLENMHCAKLYTIVSQPDANVFTGMKRDDYKEIRRLCIETILHTDMMGHNLMVKDLQLTFQMNSEAFLGEVDPDDIIDGLNINEIEVFNSPETKLLIMECILHTCDVTNPCRAWPVTEALAYSCLEEFFAQGDQEKMLGIPLQFLNDREKLNRPNAQIGFIEFMIAPLICGATRLFPSLYEYGDHLSNNVAQWEQMWAKETQPSAEEREKLSGRVQRCQAALKDAKDRKPLVT
jgi:hypothetical protein